MLVIAVFTVFVVLGEAVAIGISSLIEEFSKTVSLFAFLGMFVLVFGIAWPMAVRVTERYLLR